MRMAMGSGSLLSSHGRGIGPQDTLKRTLEKETWVPLTCAGDLRELLRVPLRSPGYCGVERGLSESTGFGAMEEGLISSRDRNLRVPPHF